MARVYDHGTYLETYFDHYEDLRNYMAGKGFELRHPDMISPAKEYFVRETKGGYVLAVVAVSHSEVMRFFEFWRKEDGQEQTTYAARIYLACPRCGSELNSERYDGYTVHRCPAEGCGYDDRWFD